jgi:hypothetical protein
VRSLLSRFTSDAGTEFVEVPLELAAPIVEQAVQRTQAEGKPLPDSAIPALRFFERVTAQPLPIVKRAGRVTLASLRTLLQRPAYRRSWFVDPSDLEACGVEPPRGGRPNLSWLVRAMGRLAASPVLVRRVIAMARHMAVWHQLRDEAAAAGLCLMVAELTEADPERSPLLRVLLEQLFVPTPQALGDEDEGSEPEPLGEPGRRQFLKSRFFLEVSAPKGRDLALLDLTEAALMALERAVEAMPGEARPREDVVQEAAHGVAQLFRDYVTSNRQSPPGQLSDRMAEIIAVATQLPAAECHRVSLMLLASLVAFVDEVCGSCPSHCLNRPRASFAAEFFSPMHPALKPTEPSHSQHKPNRLP